jgi:hypothetical protein
MIRTCRLSQGQPLRRERRLRRAVNVSLCDVFRLSKDDVQLVTLAEALGRTAQDGALGSEPQPGRTSPTALG